MDYEKIESLIKNFRDEADKNAKGWEKELSELEEEGDNSIRRSDCEASLYICLGEIAAYNTILQNLEKLK